MAKVRSLAKITDKYKRVAPTKAKEYEEGIKDTKKDWVDETAAADEAWAGGVQEAISRGAFKAGVEATGQAGWLDPALKKGVGRYRSGIEYGIPKYNKKFAPYRDVIESTDLPPRGPKGAPQNLDRVAVITAALHDEKVRRTGGR